MMIRWLMIPAGLLIGLFTLLMGGMHLATPALLTADCAMPCWQQLQPGTTTYQAAFARLQALGGLQELPLECRGELLARCNVLWRVNPAKKNEYDAVTVQQGRVVRIEVHYPDFTLGDLLAAFGQPDGALYEIGLGKNNHTFGLTFWFEAVHIRIDESAPCPLIFADLLTVPIYRVSYYPPDYPSDRYTASAATVRRELHRVCHL